MAIINGGTGQDTLPGTTGSDSISGDAGNDSLSGNSGNDTLAGGTGNDSLDGGTGSDTYRFAAGDGQDVVYDYGNNGETDTLAFGTGIAAAAVTIAQADNGRDLVLKVTGTTDQVTLDNVASSTWARIEKVTFTDGTAWTYADLFAKATTATAGNDHFYGDERANKLAGGEGNDTLEGGAGNDTLHGGTGNDLLNGGTGADTYLFPKGDGADVIYDEGGNGETDTLIFGSGLNAADAKVSQADNGRDIVIKFGTDQVTLDNTASSTWARIESIQFKDGTVWSYADLFARATTATAGHDRFWGDERANTLSGAAGNDTLEGAYGNDTLAGGIGNDSLNGGVGADTYRFAKGDGQDVIYDEGSNGETDTLAFGAGIAAADVTVSQADNGRDLVLKIGTDQITLDSAISSTWARIEKVTFQDGTVWTYADLFARATAATAGNDKLYGDEQGNKLAGAGGADTLQGGYGNDTLHGGIGNDSLNGGVGADTYLFPKGDGADVIYDEGSNGETDTLIFGSGIAASAVTVAQADNGRDLVLKVTGTTDQVTLDNVASSTWARIENIVFKDGTVWSYADLFAKATTATAGNDRFWGDERANKLAGGEGADTLTGGYGNDTLNGGTGNDSLNGGVGADAYRFAKGDGQDVIYDEGSNGETDSLTFGAGITAAGVTVSQGDNGRDLVLKITGTADQVTLDNAASSTWARIEKVTFQDGTTWTYADLFARATTATSGNDNFWGDERANALSGAGGSDTLTGGYGNDTLTGGTGNDSLNGGVGTDTYHFAKGDGQDVIYDEGSNGETDTLILGAGITAGQVSVSYADRGRDLVLKITGTSDQITLDNAVSSSWARIETVKFADGTTWTYDQLIDLADAGAGGGADVWGF